MLRDDERTEPPVAHRPITPDGDDLTPRWADRQGSESRLLSDAAIEASTAASPAPGPGCDYRLRCPVGPAVDPGREVCTTEDPGPGAPARVHAAVCHFAAAQHGQDALAGSVELR